MSELLTDRVVLITASAGTGIGFATARRCARAGATVVLSDRHERRLRECAQLLGEETGTTVDSVRCDVNDGDAVDAMIAHVVDGHGRLDVLVNNAALGATQSILDTTMDVWDAVMATTLTATFRCMQAALRHMVPRHTGVIVNLGSTAAWRSDPGQAVYAAAKAGVLALTRCAAMDVAHTGVRINAVVPSLAMHPNLAKTSSDELLEQLAREQPLGRAASPEEMADVIVFLASDLARYMTGEAVSVGGLHP
jgi:3-oxoacyl-[acyl-carrier protein] reductase